MVLLGLASRFAHGVNGVSPKPPDKGGQAPRSSRLTTDDVHRMREDSWIKPKIPSSDVIESIVAETYGHPLPIEDVGPFVIPKKYCDELLNRFREAELDKSPWQHDELGTIRIRFVGGRSIRICWFWEGQGARLRFLILRHAIRGNWCAVFQGRDSRSR